MNDPSSLMSFSLSSQKRMFVIKYESEIYLFVDFGVFFHNHWPIAFLIHSHIFVICTNSGPHKKFSRVRNGFLQLVKKTEDLSLEIFLHLHPMVEGPV